MFSRPQVKLVKLGLKSYLPTWKIQQKLVEIVKNDRKSENFLVLVEHNPVFTTGIRTNVYDSKWVILPIVFSVKLNYRKKVFYFALNFLPCEFLLIKKLDFEKTKTT